MAIHSNNFYGEEQAESLRELGGRLKNIREAQKLSLSEVSVIMKIQKRYLVAIEEGNISLLPKGPYVRGFIRQYCEFLSADDLWSTYDILTTAQNQENETLEQEQSYTAAPKIFKASSPWWIYLLIVISIVAAGWITWNYRGEIMGISTTPSKGGTASPDRAVSAGENFPTNAAVSVDQSAGVNLSWMDGNNETSVAVSAVSGTPADVVRPAVAAATAGKNTLLITASGGCWIHASSGKQILYTGTLRSGESKTFIVTDSNIKIKFGNPSGVSVTWNGVTTSPLGSGTKPVTKIFAKDGGIVTE